MTCIAFQAIIPQLPIRVSALKMIITTWFNFILTKLHPV